MGAILDCAFTRWGPGFGDPTPAGWVTVAAYALAAAAALALAVRPTPAGLTAGRRERAFWALAALYLALLAANKQLDLQTLMTDIGRCAARAQGWYGERRSVQVGVIAGLIGASLAAGLGTLWLFGRTLGRTFVALLGLTFVTAYVLVRAVGFHEVDRLIGSQVAGLRVNWLFELGAIGLFLLGVLWAVACRRRRHRPRGRDRAADGAGRGR